MRERFANAFLEPKNPLEIENPEDGMRSTVNVVPLENIFGPNGFESKILPEDDGLSAGDNHRMEFGLFDDDFEDYHEPMSSINDSTNENEPMNDDEGDQSTATARADETTYASLEENERFAIIFPPTQNCQSHDGLNNIEYKNFLVGIQMTEIIRRSQNWKHNVEKKRDH